MALPYFLVTNAAKTALESQTSSKRLYSWSPTKTRMAELAGSYMTYTFFPSSGATWAQGHSSWVSGHRAAWASPARPQYPVFQRNACRVVSYLNDPTATSYVSAYQQSVRMFLGNIISIRLALPADFLPYKAAVAGFEIRVRGGAIASTTTFNASVGDYVFASNLIQPDLNCAARVMVSSARPSKPENVLQTTTLQTSIYSLQSSSLAQASSIRESWVVPSAGYVFQNVTAFPYSSTDIVMTPSAAVAAQFASAVSASPTGEVWVSAAITEDYIYPTPMRTNLLVYLGEFEVYAKF